MFDVMDQELAILGGSPVRPRPIETRVATGDRTRERVLELLASGKLSDYYNGPWARRFEEAFASYHGAGRWAVAVNSGTSALHLALTAAGVGPGDEVILPALCFVAAATAVVQNGGVPVICDAEPASLTMDAEAAERLVSSRTKAIVAVHFWGYPSHVGKLRDLCDRHGLALIEDCAQALGAPVLGGRVGDTCDYATFAFSVRKHIACGEGGLVMCREEARHKRLRSLSNYGKGQGWDDYWSLGYSYRMAEFPAIVALDGLEQLDDEIRARQQAGALYGESFHGSGLEVVGEPPWGRSVFFKCPMLLPEPMVPFRRQIVRGVEAENVSCRVPHRPLYTIPWLAEYLNSKGRHQGPEDCPVVAAMHQRLIEIETGPHLPLAEARLSAAAVLKVWHHFSTVRSTSTEELRLAPR